MDLCVIVGNFLENAVEACRRMKRGNKFIRVRSRIEGNTLSIVVNNSFDGLWMEEEGVYLSRKGADGTRKGVGLASVRAICDKYGWLCKYEITGDVWKSSALVDME
jgi:sensor histidine kinase regulating citrate/malate metabolism